MTERAGYFPISRKAFRPEAQGGNRFWNEPRVFSRWEAWEYLMVNAAFTEHRRVIDGHTLTIPRGTIIASLRYLATAWGWSPMRVSRFLVALEKEAEIETGDETPAGTVYRLAKYELYNPSETGDETDSETEARQQRDSSETNKKKGNKGKKEKREDAPTAGVRPTNWVTEVGRLYLTETGGSLNFGEAGRHFAPLVQHHGEAEFLRVWAAACRWAKRHGKIARLKPAFFASDFGEHQSRAGDPNTCEMTDDYGVMRLHHRDPITGEWVPGEPVETAA